MIVRLLIVVVASVVVAATNVLVALILPATRLDPVAEPKNRDVMLANIDDNQEVVVVARVEVPFTVNSPVLVVLDTVRSEIEVVAREVVEATDRLPVIVVEDATKVLVALILPPVTFVV